MTKPKRPKKALPAPAQPELSGLHYSETSERVFRVALAQLKGCSAEEQTALEALLEAGEFHDPQRVVAVFQAVAQ